MTALLCIDTASLRVRRYMPQVHAGVRKAHCTHEYTIERPQTEETVLALNNLRALKFSMAVPREVA